MRSFSVVFCPMILGGLLFAAGCRRGGEDRGAAAPGPRDYPARGLVRELKADGRTVVIQHEAISNYMGAMTMPFRVRQTNELSGVQRGDLIRFRLRVSPEESWIEQIVREGRAPLPNEAAAAAAGTNQPGNDAKEFYLRQIPEFALTNEFGQPVHWRDFQGQALAMTFFFTRCPIPEYCPRLAKNFQGAIEQLKASPGGPTNYHFLSISFDPLDTPLLLRAYGRQYHYDSNHWSFVTGHPEHIRELARGFGVPVTDAGNTYTHGFSTLIFDATGRLQVMWPIGGDMTGQIVGEITKAAKGEGTTK